MTGETGQTAQARRSSAWLQTAAGTIAVAAAITASAQSWPVVAAVARTVVLVLLWVHLRDRARVADAEREVWRWFGFAALAVAIGSAGDVLERAVVGLETLPPAGDHTLFSVGTLLACPLIYRGLILWNRVKTMTTDPGDWLNGISATLALAALGNLVISWRWYGSVDRGADLQLALFQLGALLVVLGTTVTVATIGNLLRDPRPWVVMAAVLAAMSAHVVVELGPAGVDRGQVVGLGWLVLLGALVVCAQLPVRSSRARAATTQSLAVGAFVVLLAGVTILVLNTRLPPDRTGMSVLWAVLSVIGVSTRVVNLVRDLAHLAVRKQEALTDDLTGLANRRALTKGMSELAESGRPASMLLLDLDRFKEVNDRFGHATGDELLQVLAARLAAATPPTGLLARLGGDEFAVLLPETSLEDATALARLVLDVSGSVVTRLQVDSRGGEGIQLSLDASVGIATTGGALSDRDELLRQADAAMYAAKSSRTGFSVFDQDFDRRVRERADLAEEIRAAFVGTDPGGSPFVVFYQPQVSATTGRVSGAEALVRWRHPRRGLLAPAEFLELVEELGYMDRLTRHVLHTASADLAAWRADGVGPLRLSVNLSVSCLANPGLVRQLRAALAPDVDPSMVVLEVTETTLMADPEAALEVCRALTAEGFGLSIDDYGTGHSSLSYLSDLPATELKIDRAFTARVLVNPKVRAIVAGTVELGHQLGLRVIAEGAEDDATLDMLRELHCDEVQGFVFSPPRPARDFISWTGANSSDRNAENGRVPSQGAHRRSRLDRAGQA